MPRGDGTGPEGRGPMTGRGLGYCTGYETPGFTKGRPRGCGFGRGRRRFYRGRGPVRPAYPAPRPITNEEDEVAVLEEEKKAIQREMNELKKDLEEIEKRTKELEE
ncbi:MAG: DUF5320 domain-containing protein [Candidatus Aenigmatarchaeota archaeon]